MNNSTREDEICAFVVDMHEALTAFGVTAGMPSDQRREELRATLTESTPSPVPPPDDAPEWRDVPIEHVPRDNFLNIEAGDRYANHPTRGWSTLKDGTISFTRARVDYWIKRHIHPVSKPAPQTQAWRQVDSCPCCGYAGQWRDDSGRPDVCVKCKRGAGHPFAQPQTVEVLGRDMRKGDTVVAYRNDFGWQDDFKPWIVGAHSDNVGAEDVMYRVLLPRPEPETAEDPTPPADDNPQWRDMIRVVAEGAVRSFGPKKSDGIFQASNFACAFREVTGIQVTLDGQVVRAMLSGRRDIVPLAGGATYRLVSAANDLPAQEPVYLTVDVLGEDLRVGDVVTATYFDEKEGWVFRENPNAVVGFADDTVLYHNGTFDLIGLRFRVCLPRPAEVEPCASDERIVEFDTGGRIRIVGEQLARDIHDWQSYADRDVRVRALIDAINAAHRATTSKLRERCTHAEQRDARLVKRTADCTIQIDGLLREIKTLTAERDGLQDGIQVANRAADRRGVARDKYKRLAETAELLAKAARRWKASDHNVSDKDAACQALADASDAYEAMAAGTPPQASAPSVEPARLKVWDAIKAYNQAQNVLTISLINTTLAELIEAVESSARDSLHRATPDTKEATEALEHATEKRFQAERERDLALMRLRTANNNTKAAQIGERAALARATRAEALLKATRKDIMTALKDQRDD